MHIEKLRLKTHQPIAEMAAFYEILLGKPALKQDDKTLELAIGTSNLVFEYDGSGQPFHYHFAINIPHNQFAEAKAWLEAIVPLISNATGQSTFYSRNWQADMLYFYDAAGNILELIARHTLSNISDAPFTPQSLQNISEIGIAVPDVLATIQEIQTQTSLPIYQGDVLSSMFATLGDEQGLLIVVQEGRLWFPDEVVAAQIVPLAVTLRHDNETQTLSFAL